MQTTEEKSTSRSSDAVLGFLSFTLGGKVYGVDIRKVQELRGFDSVIRMENASEYIKGAVNLRGIIVPIIDVRTKLNLATPTCDQFTVVIILNLRQRLMGMAVDSVSDVITLRTDQIKPAPQMGSAIDTDYLIGLGTIEQRMLILVDIDRLMSSPDIGLAERLVA